MIKVMVCSIYQTFQVFVWGFVFPLIFVAVSGIGNTPRTPSFDEVPKTLTYERGESATLYCGVRDLGTKSVTWRKIPYITPIVSGKKRFVKDKRFSSHHVPYRDQWNLNIRNVQPQDAGVYECQVSVRRSKIRQLITLNVIENTKEIQPEIEISGTQFVIRGTPIKIVCTTSGKDYPPDKIYWYLGGDELHTNPRNRLHIRTQTSLHTNSLTSILEITHAMMKDSGKYVCRSSNMLTTSFEVQVLNEDLYDYKSNYDTQNIVVGSHNSGTSNVKRGTMNQTSRTETINTKDAAMFIHSTAGTICCMTFLQYFVQKVMLQHWR